MAELRNLPGKWHNSTHDSDDFLKNWFDSTDQAASENIASNQLMTKQKTFHSNQLMNKL